MMLISRFWYVILAVALGASVSFVYIGIHQQNRTREVDTRLIIEHDRDIVDWYLRIDSRRRLDALAIVSVDQQIRDGLNKANVTDKLGNDTRDPITKRLTELAGKFSTIVRDEGKGGSNPNALFVVDARGRVAAQVNFDRAAAVKADLFELGGFPVVMDALHGWIRDDTWVLDRASMYRVVARPIVTAEGAAPAGAIVAVRLVDDSFARIVAERTLSPVLFYIDPPDGDGLKQIARAAPNKSDVSFDGVVIDNKLIRDDKGYGDSGSSALKNQGKLTFAFSRLLGESWDLGGGYAVARKISPIGGPKEILDNADDSDKKAVPIPIVGGIVGGAILLGLLFSWLEHSRPLGKLRKEANKFGKGELDALPLPKLSGAYRKIGQDVNEGLERVIAKGGGASRKAADLEQILGPVPVAPQMSAFAFNFEGQNAPAAPPPSGPSPFDQMANLPPVGAPTSNPRPAGPPPKPAAPAMPPAKPAAPPPRAGSGGSTANEDVAKAAAAAFAEDDEDERTLVAKIPDELLGASATGEMRAIHDADEMLQWKQTFEEFLAMRTKCGEGTAGLSFEKFQIQLRRNKEQLVKQYNCKRVKFTVYEKDGKAALKATPIKE